ncbi:MAG: Homoserine O-acetyltransferase [Myxococcota bacterium]|nr:Homoserine O-acetyltransferase [Myxococcota bacterium]
MKAIHDTIQPLPRGQTFRLDSGAELPGLEIALEQYGELTPGRHPVILICHGYTMSHHAAGDGERFERKAWWSNIIGPGLAIDTREFAVLSPNIIGSCFGSSGPAARKPGARGDWGLDFPDITLADMVRAQAVMLDAMGVERLHAVVGPSMGGMMAKQWAADFPDRVGRVVSMVAPLWISGQARKQMLWNYQLLCGLDETSVRRRRMLDMDGFMRRVRRVTMETYLTDAWFERRCSGPGEKERFMAEECDKFARTFHPVSYGKLARAVAGYDLKPRAAEFRCPVLLMPGETDKVVTPNFAREAEFVLREAGVDVRLEIIPGDSGHLAFEEETGFMTHHLRAFLHEG